jgi:hypothetical protein
MTFQQDLSEIWARTIKDGQIRGQVTDTNGRVIECGLRMKDGAPQHYAIDIATGVEIGAGVQERAIDGSPFRIQWNRFRSLKPRVRPLGTGRQPDISADVSDCFFACQNPSHPLSLLCRDPLIHASAPNSRWAVFHNAIPVEKDGHFLWVPIASRGVLSVFPHWPQMLTRAYVEDFLALAGANTNTVAFYNSLHAGASVNHIHFHTVCHTDRLAIEESTVADIGGYRVLQEHPAFALVFRIGDPLDQIWPCIEKLQRAAVPFNLICTDERIFLIGRNSEHEVVEEFPAGILASMEIAGKLITTEEDYYAKADRQIVESALRKSTLDRDALLALLSEH